MPPGRVHALRGRSFRPVPLRSSDLQLQDTADHSGRTSTEPYFAWGIFSAQRSASSRSLHSSKKKPPNCSCVSAKGPSVINVLPSRMRTVVALATGESPLFDSSTPAAFISFISANQTVCETACWSSGVSSTADSFAYINNMYFIRSISYSKGSLVVQLFYSVHSTFTECRIINETQI